MCWRTKEIWWPDFLQLPTPDAAPLLGPSEYELFLDFSATSGGLDGDADCVSLRGGNQRHDSRPNYTLRRVKSAQDRLILPTARALHTIGNGFVAKAKMPMTT
jgi:hypothetical protein